VLTFPVKLTDPLTPILYITSDKQHMEDLKHAIHVKEIVEGLQKIIVFRVRLIESIVCFLHHFYL